MTRITIVGLDGGPLREAALGALSRAALVVGWPEHVAAVTHLLPPRAQVREIDRDLAATVRALGESEDERVVLTSGDPGYHGVVTAVRAAHRDVEVVPAVSSITAAFAAAGVSWEDAHLVSAHRGAPHRAIAVCRRFGKVAVLTGAGFGPAALGAALVGLRKRMVVAERLGLRGERVTTVDPEEAAGGTWAEPNVVLVLDADGLAARSVIGPPTTGAPATGGSATGAPRTWSTPPRWTATVWALPGEDGPGSHAEGLPPAVTALVLAWLGPGLGDLVWTIGSSQLAAEVSRLGAASIAVVDDAAQAHPMERGTPVAVVQGRVPAVLADLPDPDAVAIVGGDHLLTETVRRAADHVRRAVVVVLADERRSGPVADALAEAGLAVTATRVRTGPAVQGGPIPAPEREAVVIRGATPLPDRVPGRLGG